MVEDVIAQSQHNLKDLSQIAQEIRWAGRAMIRFSNKMVRPEGDREFRFTAFTCAERC